MVEWRQLPSGRVALVPIFDVADGGTQGPSRSTEWIDALVAFNNSIETLKGFEQSVASTGRFGPPMAVSRSGRAVALRIERGDGMKEVVLFDDWRDPSRVQRTGLVVSRDRALEWPHFLTEVHLRVPLGEGKAALLQRGADGLWRRANLGATPLWAIRVGGNRRVAKLLEDGRVAFGILDEDAPNLDAALAAGAMMPPCAPVTDLTFAQHGSVIVLAHGGEDSAAAASMESYRFPKDAPNRPVPIDFVAGRPVAFDDAHASFEPAQGRGGSGGSGGAAALRSVKSADDRPMILVVQADGGLERVPPTFDFTFGGPIGTPDVEWTITAFSPDGATAILQRGAKFSRGMATAKTSIPRSTFDRFTEVVMRPTRSPWAVWFLAAP